MGTETDFTMVTQAEDETTAEKIKALEDQVEVMRAVRKGEVEAKRLETLKGKSPA